MIVVPCAERSRPALARYCAHRRQAARGYGREVEGAAVHAARLAIDHGFAEVRLRAHVPPGAPAAIAPDGLTLLVRGDPWWRAMLAITVIDRIGGWFDPAFGISDLDSVWAFDPELDDFVIEVVGVRSTLDTMRVLYAGASAHLAIGEARHAAAEAAARRIDAIFDGTIAGAMFGGMFGGRRRDVTARDARQAILLGGVAAVIAGLGSLGDERRKLADELAARFALVPWTPPIEDALGPRDESIIDMHNPTAHLGAVAPAKPAIMVIETERISAKATDHFLAGMGAGRAAVRALIFPPAGLGGVPMHLADLDLPRKPRTAYPRDPWTPRP